MRGSIFFSLVVLIFLLPNSVSAWEKIIKTSVEDCFFDSADVWVSTNVHKKIVYRLKVKTIGPKDGGWSVAHTYIYRTNVRQTWNIEIDNIQCTSEEMIKNEGDTGEIEVEFDDWYRIRLEVHADIKEYDFNQGDSEGAFTYSEAVVQLFEDEPHTSNSSNSYNYADETEAMKFIVLPNQPNPFNPSTHICFMLPSSGFVTLTIYNVRGQKVRELITGTLSEGFNSVI